MGDVFDAQYPDPFDHKPASQPRATINRDKWLKALKEATETPLPESDAVSILEFAAMIGVNRAQADRRMAQLVAAGKATQTTKLKRRTDGGVIKIPAYRLVK